MTRVKVFILVLGSRGVVRFFQFVPTCSYIKQQRVLNTFISHIKSCSQKNWFVSVLLPCPLRALGRRSEFCRPDRFSTAFIGISFLWKTIRHVKEFIIIIKKLDIAYRSGNSQLVEKQFDQLENRLSDIGSKNSFFRRR